jgi:mono/diheme cytochrome c family protein
MKKYIVFIVLAFVYGACKNTHLTNPERNPNQLVKQFFQLDPSKDTSFYSRLGTRIRIPAGALVAKGKIQIEFREALTPLDIMQAGLTTQSNGKWLSSGGMVYFNATAEGGVTFQKQVEITVPSKDYDEDMQLFKGDSTDEGINWIDPKPLDESPSEKVIAAGKEIFQENCASCHKVDKDLTGPALAGVQNRWSKKWLYAFTRNNVALRATGHPYANALYEKWSKSAMNVFPNLTDYDCDAIYTYIAAVGGKRTSDSLASIDTTKNGDTCFLACEQYLRTLNQLNWEREELLSDSRNWEVKDTTTEIYFSPLSYNPLYYDFKIEANGWYNIDQYMDDPAFSKVKLQVELIGEEVQDKTIYLIVPDFKLMVNGGYLKDKKYYGFKELNGDANLPIGSIAYVLVFSEQDQKPYFGMAQFIIKEDQIIQVKVGQTNKKELESRVKVLNLEAFNFSLDKTIWQQDDLIQKDIVTVDTNNVFIDSITMPTPKIDSLIEDIKKSKPKNCDCEKYWPEKSPKPQSITKLKA